MDELKRCPFCGGEPEICEVDINGGESKNYFVRCKSCASESGWGKCKGSAIKYWNMRVRQP